MANRPHLARKFANVRCSKSSRRARTGQPSIGTTQEGLPQAWIRASERVGKQSNERWRTGRQLKEQAACKSSRNSIGPEAPADQILVRRPPEAGLFHKPHGNSFGLERKICASPRCSRLSATCAPSVARLSMLRATGKQAPNVGVVPPCVRALKHQQRDAQSWPPAPSPFLVITVIHLPIFHLAPSDVHRTNHRLCYN